jgi:hypothetical protein
LLNIPNTFIVFIFVLVKLETPKDAEKS